MTIASLGRESATVPVVTFCTDYGHGSEGVGLLHGAVLAVTRAVQIVDLTHDSAPFDLANGAREFDTVFWMPVGIHVCVVDPGVGSARRALSLETARGDVLVGPDNGVMIPAANRLGGVVRAFSIEDPRVMRMPVSATFHGRDVFATCAGWLAAGISIEVVGPQIPIDQMVPAAFVDASIGADGAASTRVVHVNRYGTATLNVMAEQLALAAVRYGDSVQVAIADRWLTLPYARTFSDVPLGTPLALPDPYERVALAINQGSFAKQFAVSIGTEVKLCRV